jgi:hypothetical protein
MKGDSKFNDGEMDWTVYKYNNGALVIGYFWVLLPNF